MRLQGYIFGVILGATLIGAVALELGPLVVGCGIKGNISTTTGERIYHVPGQKYYFVTRIDRFRGERWFCSESDARAAGWRKSRV
jgi:hypothetical protein